MTGVSRVALRPAVAGGRLLDDRVVLPLELARAGAVGVAPRWTNGGDAPRADGAIGSTGFAIASDALLQRAGAVTLVARARPTPWSTIAVVAAVGLVLGREIFPAGGVSQFQLRFRAPAGTKFESTERLATDVLDEISRAAGPNNVDITLGYVGVQPSSYPINTIFLWTGGSHEGVLQVALKPESGIRLTDFEEGAAPPLQRRAFPTAQFSFEPGDIVNRIMNFGTSTPVEVAITGPDFAASRTFAAKVRDELARIPALRDLQYGQALDYPAIQVDVNRQMAGQLGLTVDQVGRSFAAATSSSRFVAPNYWADPRTGIAFQVQIEVPQPQMTDPRRPARRAGERRSRLARAARRRRDDRATRRSSANTIGSTVSGWSR